MSELAENYIRMHIYNFEKGPTASKIQMSYSSWVIFVTERMNTNSSNFQLVIFQWFTSTCRQHRGQLS